MNEAPTVTLKPAERVVRVVKSNEAKSGEQLKRADDLSSKAHSRQSEATTLRAAESDLKSQIKSAEDIQATRGLLKKLEAGITGKAKSEKSKLETLSRELQNKITSAESAEKQKTINEKDAENATKAGVHAGAVAEANKRNISKEGTGKKGEEKSWEERVVPIEASKTLKESLDKQAELSKTLKFYDENSEGINIKYKAEPKYLMPASMINKLKQIVLESKNSTLSNRGDKEINMALVRITPMYEEIVKLIEKNGGQMDEQLIIDAFTEGLNISALKSEKNNYHHISAWVMNEFFANNKNIVGEARYPYIIAYGAGEMLNGNVANPLINLRNLLAGLIPVKQSAGNTESLGFGFVVENPLNGQGYMKGMETADPAVIEAFTKANKIALEVFETTKKRSFFTRGALTGDYLDINNPDFSRMTPTLRQPSTK